jgi:beta-lactamase superfamily II metal-dependent hydrolase
MATEIHFVDVGQGNMVLISADDGSRFVFDCNITQDNETRVLAVPSRMITLTLAVGPFLLQDGF